MKYLLDTNVFREAGKDDPHVNVRAWLDVVDDTDLAMACAAERNRKVA